MAAKHRGVETVRVQRPQERLRGGTGALVRRRVATAADGTAARTVAVIDCGASSVRAFIAEIAGAEQRVLEDIVHPVDLTVAFSSGRLDRAGMDAVARAVGAIMTAARGYGVSTARAVGTSALREAENTDVLVERLRVEHGIELEVIDGPEAARLHFEALRLFAPRAGLGLAGSTLMIDIGGGSTAVSLARDGKLVHTVDEHFGTIRMWEQFQSLRDAADFAVTVDRFSLGAAHMLLGRLPQRQVDRLVVTGGEVRRLVQLLDPESDGLIEEIDTARLAAWIKRMAGLPTARRAEACGMDAVSAGRLLPAASLVRHLCAESGAKRVLVPPFTLRDGLLADLLPGAHGPHHLDADHLLAEARQLVARYGGHLPYAENTASLAVQIFDQTTALHRLGARERLLLEFSALVHDIGSYINVRNRHKHTMYLIQAVDIAGLTRNEKDMVANIARYHRKSPPEPHHEDFTRLPRRERVVASHLAAILRLAYALDVERQQRVRKVRVTVDDGRLLLRLDRRQVALEGWSVAGKARMFEDAFGLQVVVLPREGE
ncbi:MAG: HD domain-containing protein [Planctomycetes bacterium]|nr:HD domain-containing protein [Planctomycetota bacterium]